MNIAKPKLEYCFEYIVQMKTKWNEINELALQVATNVVNYQVKLSYLNISENWGVFLLDLDLQRLTFRKLRWTIEQSLKKIYDYLDQLV